jgi:hypothetical protein
MAFIIQFTGSQVPFNPFAYPDVSSGQPTFKGHRRELTQIAGNWDAVYAEAKERGGHLVVIDSAEENAWLVKTFGDEPYWIGLVQSANASEPRGGWHWVGDIPSYYFNWENGQPDNYSGRDNCGFLLQGSGGRWHDVLPEGWPPSSNHKGIIEFE